MRRRVLTSTLSVAAFLSVLLSGIPVTAQEANPVNDQLTQARACLVSGDVVSARTAYAKVIADGAAPAAARGIAQLEIAESYLRAKEYDAAKAEYAKVSSLEGVPGPYAWEAGERIREIDRIVAGLSPRDPAASRTLLPEWPAPSVDLYVAPDGNDAAAGTKDQPFATLERARDALRQAKKEGRLVQGGATIVVRGGQYRVTQTFTLTADDSAEATAPVRYCAAGGETPIFTGGIRVEGFEPVTDAAILARLPEEARGKVMRVDLAKYGIANLKPLRLGGYNSGLGFKTHPLMELFFDGKAMPVSRWPNDGFTRIVDIREKDPELLHGRERTRVGRFTYEGDRPSRWKDETGIILYGYWFFGWADSYERVASIDTEKREIVLEEPYCGYGYRADAPFYALNLLSEIDRPGEWYLDRANNILYFYPPSDPAAAAVQLSVVDYPFVQTENVAYTTFQGITWELGGADGLIVRGGDHCLFAGCTVRRCGGDGIVVQGGSSHVLLACDVYSMGRGGMVIYGGDRKTLTPGNHLVENCDIHELSRIDHTYTPGILLNGVGNRIVHNRLHEIASSAMRVEGNDHLVELNEIHHVVQESDDQGGSDMWGNPTYRGNVYRYNYWHHIGNQTNPAEAPDCGQAGIRLDDAISGTQIYGNVFYRSSAGKAGFGGVQIHGGKDNVLDNNVFVDCMSAVSFSPWGDERWRKFVTDAMNAPAIDAALYVQRYPQLAQLAEDCDVNLLSRNLVLNCTEFLRRYNGRSVILDNVVTNANADAAHTPETPLDWAAVSTAMNQNALSPIPFDEIGLYESPLRPKL